MNSKLEKQKQIQSLLNSRALGENTDWDSQSAGITAVSGREESVQDRLVHQVFHFQRSIIQNLNSGLITIDLSGEITFVNRIAASLLTCESEVLLQKNIADLFESNSDTIHFMERCTNARQKIDEWETRFLKADGKSLMVEINAAPLTDHNNRFEGVVVLFRDITEVHQLRMQVERMERLALLGELSTGIAHEIRNPLGGIKAASQVLAENIDDQGVAGELINRIVRETDRANKLLKEFFRFARPGKAKPEWFDVRQAINGVQLLVSQQMRHKKINFEKHLAADLPRVFADETQVEQILLNLFLNAVEALHTGGTLSVEATVAKAPGKSSNMAAKAGLSIAVSDNGSGIHSENLPRIFNPFFTTKKDGLGLGLSICSRLASENGGTIDGQSVFGDGAQFVLTLPSATATT